MYSKALYASWLKATYGLRESIPLDVPRRKVPPLLLFDDPPQPVAAVANSSAPQSGSSARSHVFLMLSSLSAFERGLVHRQRSCVGVERITDPKRDGSLVLAVSERQVVDHGHAERYQVLLEHVLDRFRGAPVRDVAR